MIAAKPSTNPALCRYLNDRKIPFLRWQKSIAKKWIFKMYDKEYFAVEFENKSRGFELRNKHFKSSSRPKKIVVIKAQNSREISVF